MNIRALTHNDLDEIRKIHEKHFAHEFNFPDFMKYICAFVIEDEFGIVTAGGVRAIAECVCVTNKDRDVRVRAPALYKLLEISKFVTTRSGYDQIYAWSRSPKYTKRLERTGFRLSDGQSLILDL